MRDRDRVKLLTIAVTVVAAMVLVASWDFVFRSQVLEVKILKKDAPKICYHSYISSRKSRSFRSDVPQYGDSRGMYCGVIWSSVGTIKLPESYAVFGRLFHQKREYLYEALQEGCTYDLTVTGPWIVSGAKAVNFMPPRHHVTRLHRKIGCD